MTQNAPLMPLRDRGYNAAEFERLRLILSTFRDGGGQVILKATNESMPGFRDFERSVAAVTGGYTREDKGVFDVLVDTADSPLPYGISCKMTQMRPAEHESSFMELTNSAAKFAAEFRRLNVSWVHDPAMAGNAMVDLVSSWHDDLADEVDVPSSAYLVLVHDKPWRNFQLHAFPLTLRHADPRTDVRWSVRNHRQTGSPSALQGTIDDSGRAHTLWELYPNSGGQCKYYPLLSWATWVSPVFELELPPAESLFDRAGEYFSTAWSAVSP